MNAPNQSSEFLQTLRNERRALLDLLRQTKFSTLKKGYSHAQVVPHASYAPWLDDTEFRKTYDVVHAHTLVDIYRCHELFMLARQCARTGGAFIEIGVWRGGTAALIGKAAPDNDLHLFDTFEGVAKPDEQYDTLYKGGEHADTSEETVSGLLHRLGLKARIHVGIFPDETLHALPESISFAHIDVDTYRSAKESCEAIWPRLQPGGVIVFDDYGFFGCEGVTQAVEELRAELNGALFVHNLNGHALLLRSCPA